MANLEGGGGQQVRPLKFDRLLVCVFLILFCIRMLINKAQISRESIYKR